MVAILWARGNRHGALELESLWNDLMMAHGFALLRGYVKERFASPEDKVHLREVCPLHTHIALAPQCSIVLARAYQKVPRAPPGSADSRGRGWW